MATSCNDDTTRPTHVKGEEQVVATNNIEAAADSVVKTRRSKPHAREMSLHAAGRTQILLTGD